MKRKTTAPKHEAPKHETLPHVVIISADGQSWTPLNLAKFPMKRSIGRTIYTVVHGNDTHYDRDVLAPCANGDDKRCPFTIVSVGSTQLIVYSLSRTDVTKTFKWNIGKLLQDIDLKSFTHLAICDNEEDLSIPATMQQYFTTQEKILTIDVPRENPDAKVGIRGLFCSTSVNALLGGHRFRGIMTGSCPFSLYLTLSHDITQPPVTLSSVMFQCFNHYLLPSGYLMLTQTHYTFSAETYTQFMNHTHPNLKNIATSMSLDMAAVKYDIRDLVTEFGFKLVKYVWSGKRKMRGVILQKVADVDVAMGDYVLDVAAENRRKLMRKHHLSFANGPPVASAQDLQKQFYKYQTEAMWSQGPI